MIARVAVLLAAGLLAACNESVTHRFVRTDGDFRSVAQPAGAKLVWLDDELRTEPPLKFVGVLEFRVPYREKKTLENFVGDIAAAGARAGCDILVQRDLFETAVPHRAIQGHGIQQYGVVWIAENVKTWQFLCAVRGADWSEEKTTRRTATVMAAMLRAQVRDDNTCQRAPPIGSHVRQMHDCADSRVSY